MTTQDAAIVEIQRLGFEFDVVPQYDLDRLSPDRRVQVRESGHYAPKDEVKRYAVQMEHSVFPPIIVTRDGWIVDGNTRTGASLLRKNKFVPAIVLHVDYGTGSVKQRNELMALAATLNNLNGRPLTPKEARSAAKPLIDLGWRAEQISRAVGVNQSIIAQVRKEIAANSKLERVGLKGSEDNAGFPGPSLRALGARDPLALNDVPYKELATLVADAGLSATEVSDLAKEMKASGSDESALELVQARRGEFVERIRQHQLTGRRTKLQHAGQLRRSLGFVLKYEDGVQDLLETDPNVVSQHVDTIDRTIKVLTRLLELQQ